jgi:hypothetical protein
VNFVEVHNPRRNFLTHLKSRTLNHPQAGQSSNDGLGLGRVAATISRHRVFFDPHLAGAHGYNFSLTATGGEKRAIRPFCG